MGGKYLGGPSKYSRINLVIKKRLLVLFGIIFVIFLLLVCRVGYIQLIQGPGLQKLAVEQWTNDVKIDAKRGKIIDRNGYELAVSASCERVDAYMHDILAKEKDNKNIKAEIAHKLSGVLGDKEEDILKKLNMKLSNGNPINSVTIKRRIEKSQADEIRKLQLPGIVVSEDSKRYYPNGNFLSQVLGFTNIDGVGQEGLEKKYDKELKGLPGRIIMETDPYRREMPYNISDYIAPVNGEDLVLTIDEKIQLYVEKALENAIVTNKAKDATAIVMDPTTGEILAMASKPDFNPNNPRDMQGLSNFNDVMKLWSNRAVTFTYEPGSIFKVVTASAALQEGVVKDNSKFYCPGYKIVADRRIKCWRTQGHGSENFAQILQNSCNVGFMDLGEALGRDKLYKYVNVFGFGKPTGLDVNFEESGYKRPVNKVGPVELANLSFGQGISVTPIQMAVTMATIANDGKMMEPHIVKQIQSTDENGNVKIIKQVQPKMKGQAIDPGVAKELRNYLETVITEGGGLNAAVDGYHIAGKTGTAQKAENGRYVHGKYVASFIGMAPVDKPKYAVFVCIDEPDPSKYYASLTAAPVAREIFKDIFQSQNIPPDNGAKNLTDVVIPNVVNLTKSQASSKLESVGLKAELNGSGKVVSSMYPKAGISVKAGSKVILYLGNDQTYNNKVIVPDLHGKDEKEVSNILNSLSLKLNKIGKGYAMDQNPEVGDEITKGSQVDVEFDIYGD